MADTVRVYNAETKCKLKLKKAIRMREQGLIELNLQNLTFRNLTLAQMVARRSEIARRQEPLAHAEIPGFHVEWTTIQQQTLARQGYAQIRAANQFCLEHA